jgi:hypothetical protein
MSEPRYSKGDTWTYSIELPGRARQTVTKTVLQADGNYLIVRSVDSDGHDESVSYPRQTAVGNVGNVGINWPLSVGQRWSGTFQLAPPNPPTPGRIEISVDAYDTIALPAGTLGAFRIQMRSCIDALLGSTCGNMRMWLSPQAKAVVKLEIDDARMIWGDSRGLVMVLVSYTVAP